MTLTTFIPLFFGMRGWQIVVVALLILLLFGGKKIPELMRGLGKGVHSFKQGLEDAKEEINKPVKSSDDAKSAAADNDKAAARTDADAPVQPTAKAKDTAE